VSATKRREGRTTAIDRDHYTRVRAALAVVARHVRLSSSAQAEIDAHRVEVDRKLEEIRDRRRAMGKDR
jgi:hypothetical protein